jgi:anti-sigma factor RsiW
MDETPVLTEREEIEALLPWYVTGRLDRADRERIDRYLERHPELRHQLAPIEADRHAAVATNERIAAPPTLSADRLAARLPRRTNGALQRMWAPLRDFFDAPTAAGVRWAVAAAVVAFVLQGVALTTLLPRFDVGYETASGGAGQATRSATLLVRFAPGASLEAIGEALAKREMRIVDGPKPGQLYVIAIGPRTLGAEMRDRRAAELRALDGIVALVLPGGEAETR